MRVLLLTDADVFAGTERHILDLATVLKRDFADEINVSVACPSPSPLEEKCGATGVAFLAIPKRGLVDWNAVRVLRRLLRARRLDLIHAHNGRTALPAALAVVLARRGSLVTTQHFLSPNHATQKGVKAAISQLGHRFVTRRTKTVIAISRAVRDAMLERGEVGNEKIAVVLNGVPDPNGVPDGRNRVLDNVATREKFTVGTRPLVVCASRLQPEKGIETLISAMAKVVQNSPDALCLLAGEGVLQDALQSQIEREKLSHNVQLVGFQNDVASLVNAADVFVMPSPNEPFGLSLIEAMALGKPVVAIASGGPLEIVENGDSGFLVAPSSPDELARAISRLLGDETLREQLGQAARARYEKRFTVRRMAEEIAAIYRAAVS